MCTKSDTNMNLFYTMAKYLLHKRKIIVTQQHVLFTLYLVRLLRLIQLNIVMLNNQSILIKKKEWGAVWSGNLKSSLTRFFVLVNPIPSYSYFNTLLL